MRAKEGTAIPEPKQKGVVTFVGEGQAAVGFRFVASAPPEVCRKCKLFLVCMGRLKPGRAYMVIELKEKEHYCPLYEGKVRVAKVVQAPIEALVKPQFAVEGATVTISIEECGEKACSLAMVCRPEGVRNGDKIRIEKVGEDVSKVVPCSKRLKRVTALVVEPS